MFEYVAILKSASIPSPPGVSGRLEVSEHEVFTSESVRTSELLS